MRTKFQAVVIGILLMVWTSGCWIVHPATYDVSKYNRVHQAALDGDDSTLTRLLDANPSLINVPDYDNNTLLHLAVVHDRTNTVPLLLGRKADVNARNSAGMTPLHLAAREGFIEIANDLLEAKPKINIKDSRGWTPTKWAEMMHHDAIVIVLEKVGGHD